MKITRYDGTTNPAFPHTNTKFLYHGSPVEINDVAMAAGTYFTDDMKIAQEYGSVVYWITLKKKHEGLFVLDELGEHFISRAAIPFSEFNVLKII